MQHHETIRTLIARVRRRWRALHAFHATVRAALAAAAVLLVALAAARWTPNAPGVLAGIAGVALVSTIAALAWGFWPLRKSPDDQQVARFIEEHAPALEDRLASAVDVAKPARSGASTLADLMLADAARRASDVDIDTILPGDVVRRAGFQAAGAALVLLVTLVVVGGPARQAVDAAAISLFPARVALEVTPGNARVKAGSPLAIHARLVGNRAPVVAQLQVSDGDAWRTAEMAADPAGGFRLSMDAVSAPFKYRVVAGAVTSPSFDVLVAHPPRVTRIDVDYTFPSGLGVAPRTEHDSGDIYAPSGTDVRVHVFTDRPAASGEMALGDGKKLSLELSSPSELTASLKIVDDGSYRLALADREGLSSGSGTEYFIRTLTDRPPEVRILRPASDRSVTRLEEVEIEAQAEDDYGVARMDLVYAVRGNDEKVVPFTIARNSPNVSGKQMLSLEDLNVQPGDFISYYVRARDLTRGTRPNEARSDIFFLEVKPYEQEFTLARSQGAMAGAGANGLDDLVNAQKDIIVSTFKLDRRSQIAKGPKPEQDIRSVSKAESELKDRAAQASSTFRESTMRDPRRRQPQRGRGGPPAPEPPKAGQTLPEEDDMAAASASMGKAVASLDGLKTADALPEELDALTHLLKAQKEVKRREIQQANSGQGDGNKNRNYDLSSLFDKELQKAQQTNYETKSTVEQGASSSQQSELDKIKELASRQDELLKEQQELAKNRAKMSEEELKRALDKLTREQAELRQRAEELSRQMQGQQANSQQSQSPDGKSGKDGRQGQAGQAGQAGQSGQGGQSGQNGKDAMRDVSEEMRNATNDLRRQDSTQAAARGSRALEKLRDMERRMERGRPDEQRRAMGEMQLEARQLADAQRELSSELGKTGQGDNAKDALRRLAGEQERLADRARKLEENLKQSAGGSPQSAGNGQQSAGASQQSAGGGRQSQPSAQAQQAAASAAARELQQQKVSERMQQSAEAMRSSTAESRGRRGSTGAQADTTEQARSQVGPQRDLAKALDKVADNLASAAGTQDAESRKLSDQIARARELRDKLDKLGQSAAQSGQQAGRQSSASAQSAQKSPGESGRAGRGQGGGGGGTGAEESRLRDEYQQKLKETKDLMDQLRRDDPNSMRGGPGFTFEGQGSVFAAPGTEAFKQDFAKWEEMRRQATQALESAESTLSKKLLAKQAKDRLASGADDNAPADYKKQVDSYFKAIAGRKKP